MYKLLASIQKEYLLLLRDKGGLLILFLMPLALIITVSLIQNGSFESLLDENKLPILLVDKDKGSLSEEIKQQLQLFKLVSVSDEGIAYTEQTAQQAVFDGQYQLAIVIPQGMSSDFEAKINYNVNQILSEFGLEQELDTIATDTTITPKEIKLFFDPATQMSFKNTVKNNIEKLISQLETQSIYSAFQKELGTEDDVFLATNSFIRFKEITPVSDAGQAIIPNTTQHNVPAWTLFAMFFIVIPLSINIVKEKTQGTAVRLRTNPVSFATVLGGKIAMYLMVCLIQFALMLAIGVWLFPSLGLPQLELGFSTFLLLLLVAVFSALAAIGFGIAIGTIANTQEQSAPFGATIVVILAAIGGVWVPVFLMPSFMQILSNVSPMNWGLTAFQDILIRQGGFFSIIPEISLLLFFFFTTVMISIFYEARKNAV